MKKLFLLLFAVGGYFLFQQTILAPRAEIEAVAADREPATTSKRENDARGLGEYLGKNPGKINAGQTSNRDRADNTSNSTNGLSDPRNDDPGKVAIYVHETVSKFWDTRPENVAERTALINAVLQNPKAATSSEFKEFLLAVLDSYHDSQDLNLKTVSENAMSAYNYVEGDPEARARIKAKYVRTPASEPPPANSAPLNEQNPAENTQ